MSTVSLAQPVRVEEGFQIQGDAFLDLSKAMTQIEGRIYAIIEKTLSDPKLNESANKYGMHIDNALESVKISHSRVLLVNLKRQAFLGHFGAATEDFLNNLRTSIEFNDDIRSLNIRNIIFALDGKTFDSFGSGQTSTRQIRGAKPANPSAAGAQVVVAAGHGVYYHYGFKDWRPQRDPSNGITEDYLTPQLASKLAMFLRQRSKATPIFARDTSATKDPASKQPWNRVAARYYLKRILPNNASIWNSTVPQTTVSEKNLKDRNQDIKSRPLYANHLKAAGLLHVHTNAASSTTATGTDVFYNSKLAANGKLAANISCYMKEIIRAQENYETFVVRSARLNNTSYAELNYSNVPTAIIEVAFHTNPTDAQALKDTTVFQVAAMKGVEKGWRLYAEGEGCEPFAISSIPNITLPPGNKDVEIAYKGFPEFAVAAKIEVVTCPPSWACSGGTVNFETKQPSPLVVSFYCINNTTSAGTITFRTTLTDFDKVKTKPKDHSMTCTPGSSSISSRNSEGAASIVLVGKR